MFDELNYAYPEDAALLRRLGLEPFSKLPHGREHLVGEVVVGDHGRVKIFVTCMPAQFWRFVIEAVDGERYRWEVRTGSGTLTRYWPAVEQMAEGMFVVSGGVV
jgi:hypothetical protein